MGNSSYAQVMARRNEIMKSAVGLDYSRFESGGIAFDYEAMMAATGLTMEEVLQVAASFNVGIVTPAFLEVERHEPFGR